MLCQECGKRPATLHFTKIVNGDKTEFHLCDVCAREKGEIIPGTNNGFSIHNLISGLLDFDLNHHGHIHGGEPMELQCSECGMTYAQFSKMGRFGCSSCYEYFSPRLDPLLRRIHGNTAHVGKVPRRAGGKLHIRKQLEQLKAKLAQAVEKEEFEKAAVLRDEIRKLEKQM